MTSLAVPSSRPGEGERALLDAAARGEAARARALLVAEVDPDCADERGLSPLALAGRGGHVGIMRTLFEAGAGLDRPAGRSEKWPPLMHALHAGQRRAALALLEWGADPNVRPDSGFSALMIAAGSGDEVAVEALLQRGADPSARLFLGFTALDYAIGYGHAGVVRRLLAAAPHLRDDPRPARRAVLLLARATGRAEILALVPGVEGRA